MTPSTEPVPITLNQTVAILWARRRLVVLIAAAIVALTAVVLVIMPRTWTATADIFIDYKVDDPIGGRSFSPLLDESYMQTQIDMIHSQAVAELVLDKLGLRRNPEADKKLTEIIRQHTDIDIVRGSRVISVSYSADRPTTAQEFANTIVRSYIELSQRLASDTARTRREQYVAQLDQLRTEIDSIQQQLTQYQQETGILNVQEHGNLESRKLNDMTSTLLGLQGQKEAARTLNETIDRLLAGGVRVQDLPQLGQLQTLRDMKESLNIVNRRIGEVQGALGNNHPTMRGLHAERQQLTARIRTQAEAALQDQRDQLSRLADQETTLQRDIQRQQDKVLEQLQQRDRMAAYQRQVTSAQQVYDAALQKFDSLLMASAVTLNNATILRSAEVPGKPERPRIVRSLMLSVIVGLLAGLIFAFFLELLQRKVRCPDDMRIGQPFPMLGRIGISSRTDLAN